MPKGVEEGQEVHYVEIRVAGTNHKGHVRMNVFNLTEAHGKLYGMLFPVGEKPVVALDEGKETYPDMIWAQLALSREAGTWHPIGGFGCDEEIRAHAAGRPGGRAGGGPEAS